jgi:hypothetical protein
MMEDSELSETIKAGPLTRSVDPQSVCRLTPISPFKCFSDISNLCHKIYCLICFSSCNSSQNGYITAITRSPKSPGINTEDADEFTIAIYTPNSACSAANNTSWSANR